jgi:ATP-dependent helicase/nuclease subunit A
MRATMATMPEAAMTERKAISAKPKPPDQAERSRALDPTRSFLVQAPAGSGKTYLLTQRFLRLLAQAEKPDEIVAITFTNAAAAEMRNRVLDALENAALEKAESEPYPGDDPESLPALAALALKQSKQLGWQILDQPSQLRITTIDAFCRGLALQSPLSWGLLSGLGGRLDPVERPQQLYRRAARRTLDALQREDSPARRAVEQVLLWRDNNWSDVEDLIVEMLAGRNRWYQEFVFARNENWEALRRQLEAPFRRAALHRLASLCHLLEDLPGAVEFALSLARFACETAGKLSPLSLAERAELPTSFESEDALLLEDAAEAYRDLACFLLTAKSEWRKKGGLKVDNGFPPTPAGKAAKERFGAFVDSLAEVPGLQEALAAFQQPMPVRYTAAEWELMQHCFAVLRNAAIELQMVFAETGSVDFTEIAQIALRILAPENGFPSDFAIRQADGIRHLLIDEFQDTSRNQHQLLANLIAAWPEREGRSCFCVGDPMQSIYGFREAEVELFERLKTHGLETPSDPFAEPFRFEFLSLRTNFRTVPSLVADLNEQFEQIFSGDDGSGIRFFAAEAARQSRSSAGTELHLAFTRSGKTNAPELAGYESESTRETQLRNMVALIRGKLQEAEVLRSKAAATRDTQQEKFRIAVLARTRSSVVRIAEALQQAAIRFRAIDLVKLRERPEVLDALSLTRALLNPVDRTAWLGVLRAPWCGLSLAELHLLTSADNPAILTTPIPTLLASRLPELCQQGRLDHRACAAAARVGRVLRAAVESRSSAANSALGTWLESVWNALGGADTVSAEQGENLRLLWAAFDKMPEGELDLLGPGLDAALDELYALPDPAASTDFGVQLMTIHKSKGLEFEVVLVPDLEAEGKTSERTMMSWLERGLTDPQPESGQLTEFQLTEFLIAPIQAKGTEAGIAKRWVDRVKRERERQELRRVLYVAATRAREELHLFARPRFSVSRSSGEISLANPTGLMRTAWPALGEPIEEEFAAWQRKAAETGSGEVLGEVSIELETLAAQAGPDNLVQMPSPTFPPARPTMVRRLPEAYIAPEFMPASVSGSAARSSGVLSNKEGLRHETEDPALYARTEGRLHSRLLGSAIHTFLERLSSLRKSMSPAEAAQTLVHLLPPVIAEIRNHGLPRAAAEQLAREALAVAQEAFTHPVGAWILTPHSDADAEVRWTGLVGAGLVSAEQVGAELTHRRPWNLRPDRIFFASDSDLLEFDPSHIRGSRSAMAPAGDSGWWIIDYKTSHATGIDLADAADRERFLTAHREQHVQQLAAYAEVLRGLRASHGEPIEPAKLRVTAGIFYPRLQLLDFWDA